MKLTSLLQRPQLARSTAVALAKGLVYLASCLFVFFAILATLAELEMISTADQWAGIAYLTVFVAPVSLLMISVGSLIIILICKRKAMLFDWLFLVTWGISTGVLTFISFGFLTGLGVLRKIVETVHYIF